MDEDNSCKRGMCCFVNLSRVESIDIGDGNNSVMPIYNKISNKSNSCVRNRTTYYETLCTGTPEGRCPPSSKTFVPNGCVSSGYNHNYEVKGTRWGTCSCNTANGQYDTRDACSKATGKGCTKATYASDSCYKTCESLGYFSTERACKENLPSGYKCLSPGSAGDANCFTRYQPGFAIRYASYPKRTWSCYQRNHSGTDTQQTLAAWLTKVKVVGGKHTTGDKPETIDGYAYGELSDKEYRYEAGTYFVCSAAGSGPVGINKTVVNGICFADTISSQYNNTECKKPTVGGNSYYSCIEVTFREGGHYTVSMSGTYDSTNYSCSSR